MTRPDDHDDVLHHALDPGTVDRLLRGELAQQDTPSELSDAASLIRAARGAASADELIDRAGSVDALVGAGLRRSRGDSRGGNAPEADAADDGTTVDLRRATRLPGPVRSLLLGLLAAAALAGAAGAATGAIPVPGLTHRDEPTTTLPPSRPGADDGSGADDGNGSVARRRSDRRGGPATTVAPDGPATTSDAGVPPAAVEPTVPTSSPAEVPTPGTGGGTAGSPAPESSSGGSGNGNPGGNGANPPGQGAGSSNPNAGGTNRNANAPAAGTNNAGGNSATAGGATPNGQGAGSSNPNAGGTKGNTGATPSS